MISYPFTSNVTYDEAGQPTFDRAIGSEDLRNLYKKDRSNGVVMLGDSGALMVGSLSISMGVNVYPGYCFINGATGYQGESLGLKIPVADTTYNRIDLVVARYSASTRSIYLAVVKGVPAANPQPPDLVRTDATYELALAQVFVKKGATVITPANITDTRNNTDLCGYSIPLQAIDTTHITDQLQWQINQNTALIQSALDKTTAGYLQNQIDALKGGVWQDLGLDTTSSFENYTSGTACRIKKQGDLVSVRGQIKAKSQITGSNTEYKIFTLPEGMRPSQTHRWVMQGYDKNIWTLNAKASGDVAFSAYRTGSEYANLSTAVVLVLNFSFMI